jgi:hypothetical protein
VSNFASIPDFGTSPEGMSETLRAIKSVVEQLAGQRQGESSGSPQVFVRPAAPMQGVGGVIRDGDLWIDSGTRRVYWWDGRLWQGVGTEITEDQAQAIADGVSGGFLTEANLVLDSAEAARDLAIQAQNNAQASADLSNAYRAQAESARDAALQYRDTALSAQTGAETARDEAQVLSVTLNNEVQALDAKLTNDYLTSVQTNAAIASATTQLQADLEAPSGSIGQINATLTNDYYTAALTDAAIASATQTLGSNLQNQINATNATLTNDYFTAAQTNVAISSATTALQSQLESPSGSIGTLNATLTNDYYTIAATDNAISQGITTYNSSLVAPTGAIGQINANLTNNYYTQTATDQAISSQITTYNANLVAPSGAVGSLEANLTNNYYTKVAADSATAAQINTYDASVPGGVTAKVISHETAIANLDGHARATAGFRVQAGNAVSLLDLVAFESGATSYSLAKISAGTIILDGSVGGVQISNLSIGTGKIENNAITVPIAVFNNGPVAYDTNHTLIVEVSFVRVDAPLLVSFGAVGNVVTLDGTEWRLEVLNGTTLIYSRSFGSYFPGSGQNIVTHNEAYIDNQQANWAGGQTQIMRLFMRRGGTSGTFNAYRAYIQALAVQK